MIHTEPPRVTLQQILQKQDALFRDEGSNAHVEKVMNRIRVCRTQALGYHLYRCQDDNCRHLKYQ
jgi:hypothetical protein